MTKLYGIFGTGFLALLFLIQYTGWSTTPVDKMPNVPKNIRNNPGAYRAVYTGYMFRGK